VYLVTVSTLCPEKPLDNGWGLVKFAGTKVGLRPNIGLRLKSQRKLTSPNAQ